MNYMTPKEAAEKWRVSLRRVQYLCNENRIPGVLHLSRRWLIPINATYPQRAPKIAKTSSANIPNYHFPLFLYSDYYATSRDLSPVEQELLQAQILMAQGKHAECVDLCHTLEKHALAPGVAFGVYCTIVLASFPLGLYHEIISYLKKMDKIRKTDPVHEADYLLLMAICRFQYTYESAALKAIDISQLSPAAMLSYECFLLQISILTTNIETKTALQMYSALCKNLEDTGNLPTAFICHAMTGLFYARAGNKSGLIKHIQAACRIGCENGFYGLLTKFSSLAPSTFKDFLPLYDQHLAGIIDRLRLQNQTKWRIVYNYGRGERLFPDCSAEEADLLLLLSSGMTNKNIARITNLSGSDVRETIKQLCNKYAFHSRAQLVTYAKRIFTAQTEPQK